MHRIPHKDPVSGGELFISELTSEETGITIRGNFEIPRYAKLDTEQLDFLEVFLRCRGMLNGVERELGISYPTARARLDTLLGAVRAVGQHLQLSTPSMDALYGLTRLMARTRGLYPKDDL